MIHRRLLPALAAVLAAGAMQNPVMPGDHPDPSVIHFENQYWAANTSSEWAPLFPLFESNDLLHWTPQGSVFTDPPSWAAANFWAPELTVDQGKVRVYYAARRRNGPLCVAVASADKPSGPYTDGGPLVCQPDGSIDPFFIRDEKGVPYLIWKEDANSRNQASVIFAQPMNNDGLHLTGSPRELIRADAPWEGKVVEGPDIVRHGDYYYLIYAGGGCCGPDCNYGVGVARSHDVLGPWQKDPGNPIVTANSQWKCPGHGTAVAGPGGQDYFLYHAYPQRGFLYTGREAVLDRIAWGKDWPAIGQSRGPSTGKRQPPPEVHDDFRAAALRPEWEWPLHDRPTAALGQGSLTLSAPQARAGDPLGAILAQTAEDTDFTADASIVPASVAAGQTAGVGVLADPKNAAGVALRNGRIVEWQLDNGQWKQVADAAAPAGQTVSLRIQSRSATQFHVFFATGNGGWTEVGKGINVSSLGPWRQSLHVALLAGGAQGAKFTDFDLRYGR